MVDRKSGIGKALLRQLVERAASAEVFLTTLGSTAPLYETVGFSVLPVAEIPR